MKNNNNCYYYIDWPESQLYMEELWFDDEAVLDINQGSAYFIPKNRIIEFDKKQEEQNE